VAKAALALYHKVLPPTLGVTTPNPKARFVTGPLYINAETRPWIHGTGENPRRAGVSAFGFGGTNFHAVLEEYVDDFLPRKAVSSQWPSELLVWTGASPSELVAVLRQLEAALTAGASPELSNLAFTLAETYSLTRETAPFTVAIVASTL